MSDAVATDTGSLPSAGESIPYREAYPLHEVCTLLDVSYKPLKEIIDRGELKIVKVGRVRKVPRWSLLKYINAPQDYVIHPTEKRHGPRGRR